MSPGEKQDRFPEATEVFEAVCAACGRRIRGEDAYSKRGSGGSELFFCCPMCHSAYDAGEVQRRLIAAPFANDRIRISVEYQPALQVGGDYAHIAPRDEDRIFVMIGDVTGHGIKPSLVVGRIGGEIHGIASGDLSPADIALRLHQRISQLFGGENVYLTYFGAVIDLSSRSMTYTNCGHPAALLWSRQESTFRRLPSHHFPLGLVDDETFGEPGTVNIPYCRGDRLVLYTDGIIEGEDRDGQELGEDGFEAISRSFLDGGGQEPDGSLMDSVRLRMPGSPADDLLILVCELL